VRQALALGIALQLTNILRDVGEDARRGRIYLPKDELARFGISEEQVVVNYYVMSRGSSCRLTPTCPSHAIAYSGTEPLHKDELASPRSRCVVN
jgi:hypothetical protein